MQMLANFINAPYNPITNFNLALEYENLNQTAAAASFYLRTAEKTNDLKLQYMSLIRNAICFEKQGNRDLTVKTLLQRAITVLPTRPEGYFLLSRLYEQRKEYHDGYITACLGLQTVDNTNDILLNEYPGKYGLMFLKAVCGWWVGLNEESREIMFDLYFNYTHLLTEQFKTAVQNNINNIGLPKHKFVYTNSLLNEIKYPFNNIQKIKNNYAQVYQDLFVLTVLDGKQNGSYLELGSNDPFYNSNTALLETVFEWRGISIELDQSLVNEFNSKRKNLALCKNALDIDYKQLLENYGFDNIVDYLQVDCDPPNISFEALKKVLSSGFKFRVITFEHDYYVDNSIKQLSRDLLISHGYNLLVNDVAFNTANSFEDWWVLNKVDNMFIDLNNNVNFIQDLFFEKLNSNFIK